MSAALIAAAAAAAGLPALARGDDAVPPPTEPSSVPPVELITSQPTVEYAPGQLVVGIADDATRTEVQSALQDAGATVEQSIGAIDTKVVKLPAGQVDEAIDSLEQSAAVEYVEPEVVMEATDTIPNDVLWKEQWGPERVRAQKRGMRPGGPRRSSSRWSTRASTMRTPISSGSSSTATTSSMGTPTRETTKVMALLSRA